MAEYKVVEVGQLDTWEEASPDTQHNIRKFETTLLQFCSGGWDIVSTKLLSTDNGTVLRALVVLAR